MTEAGLDPSITKHMHAGSTQQLPIPTQVAATNWLSSRIFYAVVALAPLPFGSHDPATAAFWCFILAVAAALCSPASLGNARTAIGSVIIALLAVFLAVAFRQFLSPPAYGVASDLWEKTHELIGGAIAPSIAMPRMAPLYHLGPAFVCSLSLLLGLILAADRKRAQELLAVCAWSGAAYAVYGIISAIIEPGMILWRERYGYYGDVLGPFPYRNTAATYFGSCTAIWLFAFCEIIKRELSRAGGITRENLSEILYNPSRDIIIRAAGFFICLMALLMTGSRAGTTISLGVLTLAVAVYFRRDLPAGKMKFLAIGGGIFGLLVFLQLFGGLANRRFDTLGLVDEGRPATYLSTLKIIGDHPWLGTGLGTFPSVFPQYRGDFPSITGIWELAHSTPLEFAAEMGLPLTFLVGLGWMMMLTILIRGTFVRRRDSRIPLTGAAVALIALAHSSVDFALQIEGYAIFAMAVIGCGLAQSFRSTPPVA